MGASTVTAKSPLVPVRSISTPSIYSFLPGSEVPKIVYLYVSTVIEEEVGRVMANFFEIEKSAYSSRVLLSNAFIR